MTGQRLVLLSAALLLLSADRLTAQDQRWRPLEAAQGVFLDATTVSTRDGTLRVWLRYGDGSVSPFTMVRRRIDCRNREWSISRMVEVDGPAPPRELPKPAFEVNLHPVAPETVEEATLLEVCDLVG